ncbi:zinc-binding dehydrogenase [Streptosporangium lutulentum]
MHSASGGIGGALAQLVPLLGGGRLIGTVGRQEKVAAAERSGYDVAVARGDRMAEAIRAANDGRGIDVVLDPLGTTALELDLEIAAPGARVVMFGNATGEPLGPLPSAGRLIGGNITLSGFSHRGLLAASPQKVSTAIRRVLGFLAAGQLSLPVVELPSLDDVPAAHDLLAAGHGTGKYVVRTPR